MLIFLPIILMLLTALGLLILHYARPAFKYPWMLAAGGTTLAFISVGLWQIRLPQNITLPPWQPSDVFKYTPAWLADGISWPYALSLAALAAAVIWTSVVRAENEPMTWASTLALTSLGILAVAAGNPLTLVLIWTAIDLFELVTMLRSTDGPSQSQGVVIAFAARLAGTGLVLWAKLVSAAAGLPLDFRSIPASAGIYLLIAAGLRLGVLPLHLPYRKENVVRRGFGTALRLVSAAASLALLARVPASALGSALTPYLLILTAVAALYAGWMWLRASDEILGRPFWVLGLASLSVAESLRGNPAGSIGWGVALILSGGLLFLFSARRRNILWLPWLGLWALSALPYSPTAAAWQAGNGISWLFVLPFLPAQALLAAGFFRHTLHPGETSLESQERWVKILYPVGLLLLVATAILLGLWGWAGAHIFGMWWQSILIILLTVGFTILAFRSLAETPPGAATGKWIELFRLEWFYRALAAIFEFLRRIMVIVSSAFEGESGLLWSFLVLVLILSVLSLRGH